MTMNTNKRVFITGANRTPIGKFQGKLSKVKATKLGSICISSAIKKSDIQSENVDYVIIGNMLTAGEGMTPARQSAVESGIPTTISALTINKACASGIQSVILAAQSIKVGDASIIVAGGMENMSLSPHVLVNSRTGARLGNAKLIDTLINDGLWCPFENRHMGDSAEFIASKYKINREDQDKFAEDSHSKAIRAINNNDFKSEITNVQINNKKSSFTFSQDEGPRSDAIFEKLNTLKHAFTLGDSVTAGNASQISDGASAMIVRDEHTIKNNSGPVALISGYAHSANDHGLIFDAPPDALNNLLFKTKSKLSDFDLIEINEAFAAQVLANEERIGWDRDKVNINGGAIALGHPVGASGARILTTLIHSLSNNKLKKGLALICHGGGGAVAMSIELM